MKLENFLASFNSSGKGETYFEKYKEVGMLAMSTLPELSDLFNKLSGTEFEEGLLKIHTFGSSYFWTAIAFEFFKRYKGTSYCFAFDWFGRQYAVNYSGNKTLILLLDPATAEVFEMESNIQSFLNEDTEEFKEVHLDKERFTTFYRKMGHKLKFSQCVGFKKPLFLGGKDDHSNFETGDMEVYWELNYQIYNQIKNLPGGTLIDNIKIE